MEKNWAGEVVPIPILVLLVSKDNKGMAEEVEVAMEKELMAEEAMEVVAELEKVRLEERVKEVKDWPPDMVMLLGMSPSVRLKVLEPEKVTFFRVTFSS